MEGKKRKCEEEPSNSPEMGIKNERTVSLSLNSEEQDHCPWNSLPVEIGSIILHQATNTPDLGENSSALIVCRFVCRQWRDSLPQPPSNAPTSRFQSFATHFISLVAEKGYLSILKWARENGCLFDATTFRGLLEEDILKC